MKESMAALLISAGIVFGGFGLAVTAAVIGHDNLFTLGSTVVTAGIGFFLGHRAGAGNGRAASNGG